MISDADHEQLRKTSRRCRVCQLGVYLTGVSVGVLLSVFLILVARCR